MASTGSRNANVKPSPPKPSLLIAFGGNALNVPDALPPHQKEEFMVARKSMQPIPSLVKQGYRKIIITHGNGPQVGQIFLQQELTRNEFPRQITLDVCVADSQGRIGYILQNVFDNVFAGQGVSQRAFAIITQVLVDAGDPAFNNPTKPIGVFYSRDDARELEKKRGWVLKEDAGRGYRRVVPSPQPLDIVEKAVFQDMLNRGFIAIGAGGGGIPVIRAAGGRLEGVEAVIDKDRTSALLAAQVGIDYLVILTSVDFAYRDFNTASQKPIEQAALGEMEAYLKEGHFRKGSMKPKVEAAIHFLKAGGKRAIIANLYDLHAAVEGKTGTQIHPDP
ncbi:MAG: carbamate kinase [Nitrospinaceae bacterium]